MHVVFGLVRAFVRTTNRCYRGDIGLVSAHRVAVSRAGAVGEAEASSEADSTEENDDESEEESHDDSTEEEKDE